MPPRLPLILAFAAILVAVAAELGSRWIGAETPPGLALPALALVDGLLAWTGLLLASATVLSQDWHSRLRILLTILLCLVLLLGAVVMIRAAFGKLMLMVSLILAVPFGPIAYAALFGRFETAGVMAALSVATLARASFLGLLLLASWRYLGNRTLVLLTATGFLGGLVISATFAFLPGVLHSIGDAVCAILLGIIAFVWALVLLVRSLPGLVKLLRVDRLA